MCNKFDTQVGSAYNVSKAIATMDNKINELANLYNDVSNAVEDNTSNIAKNSSDIVEVIGKAETNANDIVNLNGKITDINNEQNTQNNSINELTTEISSLKNEQNTQNNSINELTTEISSLKNEQNTQNNSINELTPEISSLKNEQTSLDTRVTSLEGSITQKMFKHVFRHTINTSTNGYTINLDTLDGYSQKKPIVITYYLTANTADDNAYIVLNALNNGTSVFNIEDVQPAVTFDICNSITLCSNINQLQFVVQVNGTTYGQIFEIQVMFLSDTSDIITH